MHRTTCAQFLFCYYFYRYVVVINTFVSKQQPNLPSFIKGTNENVHIISIGI